MFDNLKQWFKRKNCKHIWESIYEAKDKHDYVLKALVYDPHICRKCGEKRTSNPDEKL